MATKSEFHTDKFALDRVCPLGRVRFMEIFGENAAQTTRDQMLKSKPDQEVIITKIKDAKGWIN